MKTKRSYLFLIVGAALLILVTAKLSKSPKQTKASFDESRLDTGQASRVDYSPERAQSYINKTIQAAQEFRAISLESIRNNPNLFRKAVNGPADTYDLKDSASGNTIHFEFISNNLIEVLVTEVSGKQKDFSFGSNGELNSYQERVANGFPSFRVEFDDKGCAFVQLLTNGMLVAEIKYAADGKTISSTNYSPPKPFRIGF